jgi:hypothetical protein
MINTLLQNRPRYPTNWYNDVLPLKAGPPNYPAENGRTGSGPSAEVPNHEPGQRSLELIVVEVAMCRRNFQDALTQKAQVEQ